MKRALIISCFNWYKQRLEVVRKELIFNGYEVTVLIADFEHITKKPVDIRYPECNYVNVPKYKKNISIQRICSHLVFGRKVGKWINTNKPDLIYCQLPPNNTARYCRKYKEQHPETKLFLDIIDLWPESLLFEKMKNIYLMKMWKGWRDNCIAVSNHVFTECNLYRERFNVDCSKISALFLYKNQSIEEEQLIRRILEEKEIGSKNKNNLIKFAYVGSMNNIIDISGICKVIRQFINKGFMCELYAIGGGEKKEKFEFEVSNTGCKVHFYGQIFDEKTKIDILTPCDYALNIMKNTVVVGLTIKSIDYLSYGIPLINNIKGDTWELVQRENIGINIGEDFIITKKIFEVSRQKVREVYQKMFSEEAFVDALLEGLQLDECR